MRNLLSRKFTRRELVLLIILAVVLLVGLYFLLVHYPIANRMDEIELEEEDLAIQMQVAEVRLATYTGMKLELESIKALPQEQVTVMPPYDNIETLMVHFNGIFAGMDPQLTFDPVNIEESIATRTMRFTFTASNYAQAKRVLGQLTNTGYRCLLETVSVSPLTTDGEIEVDALRVTGAITFYETIS